MLIDMYNSKLSLYAEDYRFCYWSCIRQILEYYNINDPIFFIDCSLKAVFDFDKKNKYGYKISYRDKIVLPDYVNKIKFFYNSYTQEKDSQKMWNEMKNKIDKSIPLIVGADLFFLPYHKYFNLTHRTHAIILCGYTPNQKNIYIIDWDGLNFFKGEITYEEFITAWDDNFFIEVEKTGWTGNVHELFYETISLTINNYFNKESKGFIYYGLVGLKKLQTIISQYKGKDNEFIRDFTIDLHTNLRTMLSFKQLFKLYIQLYFQKYKLIELEGVCKKLDDIVLQWKILLSLILKCSYNVTEKNFHKIENGIINIIISEEVLFTDLLKLKESLSIS